MTGHMGERRVTVQGPAGFPYSLPPFGKRNQFNWGYLGTGPATLSRAILYYATWDVGYAEGRYWEYLRDVVSTFNQDDDWLIEGREILDWINRHP